jgi:hypothetical protein
MANDFFGSDGATYPWYMNNFPAAAYDANTNKLWVTWEGWNGSNRIVRVRVYDYGTAHWTSAVTVANSPLTGDDHGAPAICRDHQGYWHVFFGSHNSLSKHYVTTNPDDPTAWTARPDMLPAGESGSGTQGITYPHPVLEGSTLYVFFRDAPVDNSHKTLILYKTTALSGGAETWGLPVTIADFGANTWWEQGTAINRSGKFHFPAMHADNIDTSRADIFYYIYDTSDGSLKNYDESFSTASGSFPVNLSTQNSHYRIYTSSGNTTFPALAFDTNGNPHVLFADGTGAVNTIGNYPVYHMGLFAGSWTSPVQVGTSQEYGNFLAIVPGPSGTMTAYWSQSASFGFGGNLKMATRSAGSGGTWGSESIVLAEGTKAVNTPQMILNGPANARVIFAEISQSPSDGSAGNLKLYAYGDTGYLKDTGPMTINPSNSRKITLTNHPSSTLTNFPVLVSITDPTLKTVANGGSVQNSNGYDIVFAADSANVTPYSWEMESYDGAAGKVTAWVLIPSFSSSVDTAFYMLWGDASISTFQSTASAVWDSNYKGVWHLGDGTTLSVADSTSGANNGTNHSAAPTSGKVGGSANFNGTSQYIDLGNNANLKVSLPATISFWMNRNASYNSDNNWNVFNNNGLYGAGHNYAGLTVLDADLSSTDGRIEATFGDNAGATGANRRSKRGTTILSNATDYFITAVIRGATDMTIYLNGVDDGGTYSGSGARLPMVPPPDR